MCVHKGHCGVTLSHIALPPVIPLTQLPIKDLKQTKRQKLQINLNPQGVISLVIEYFANMASLARKPTLQSSGVFGVPIEVVAA